MSGHYNKPIVGWKPAPRPKNMNDFNRHPYNAALANGPGTTAARSPDKLPASRGLLARGVNPVLGFIVISTLAWCSFQMLTESRAGDKKGRVFQHPMAYDNNMKIDPDYYPGKDRRRVE